MSTARGRTRRGPLPCRPPSPASPHSQCPRVERARLSSQPGSSRRRGCPPASASVNVRGQRVEGLTVTSHWQKGSARCGQQIMCNKRTTRGGPPAVGPQHSRCIFYATAPAGWEVCVSRTPPPAGSGERKSPARQPEHAEARSALGGVARAAQGPACWARPPQPWWPATSWQHQPHGRCWKV